MFKEFGPTIATAMLQAEKREMRTAIIIRWQSGAIALTAIVLDGYMAARIDAEDAKENERSASVLQSTRD